VLRKVGIMAREHRLFRRHKVERTADHVMNDDSAVRGEFPEKVWGPGEYEEALAGESFRAHPVTAVTPATSALALWPQPHTRASAIQKFDSDLL